MKRRTFLSLVAGILCAPLIPKPESKTRKGYIAIYGKDGKVSFFEYSVLGCT